MKEKKNLGIVLNFSKIQELFWVKETWQLSATKDWIGSWTRKKKTLIGQLEFQKVSRLDGSDVSMLISWFLQIPSVM